MHSFVKSAVLMTFALLLLGSAVGVHAQQCPTLVWSDEFDGTSLDLTKWEPQIGDGCDIGLCGWGNSELQFYKAENATVANGLLTIEAKRERNRGSQYTSARLRTINLADFQYGRFEARIKIPEGQGMWPAFWMLSTDEIYGGWPQSGEIDIMENIGREPSTVHGTIHYGQPWPDNASQGASYTLSGGQRFADDFHVFAIEKEAGEIRWYMDGVHYLTKNPSDVSPENWPFDERFHFILNVAVGGVWPGDPDSTTSFPQTMDVDYVRVYDGNFPSIGGDALVAYQEQGVVYSVGNAPGGSTFSWTVPAGATIVSGAGTSSITVDWGDAGGDVSVDVSSGCGTESLSLNVTVEQPVFFELALENFDDPANATVSSATGTLNEVSNPDASGVNTSALSGEYTRNAAEQYDVLVYATSSITDADKYSVREKKFYVDLYTSAPVGTHLILQLEDSGSATPSNFPTGRHSRYEVFTTVQNAWERLEFQFVDRPDGGVATNAVDTFILLFEPNTFNANTYFFDNLDSYGPGSTPPPPPSTTMSVSSVSTGTQGAGRGQKYGTATVTVVDANGDPVAGATVSGDFSGTFSEAVSGTTDASGSVSFQTSATASGGVSVNFCVSNVSHPSLTWSDAPPVCN